jgi:hypothetical protein
MAAAGPLAAFAALFVWVLGAPLAALDALVAVTLLGGLTLSSVAWVRRRSQLGVVGVGLNAGGLLLVLYTWAAG